MTDDELRALLEQAHAGETAPPLGAMLAREDVANSFMPGSHASTFGGNPVCCAAGLAVMAASS